MKRIDDDIQQKVLDEVDDEEYLNVLRPLLKQKIKSIKAENDYERNQKLVRFALGRGFTFDIIKQCLDVDEEDFYNIAKFIAEKRKKYSNLINVNVNTLVSDVFSKPIESLNFSVRTNNALTAAGYTTLNDLYNIEVADLFSIKNLGKSSIQEIVDVLDKQKATHPKWKTLKESITKMI